MRRFFVEPGTVPTLSHPLVLGELAPEESWQAPAKGRRRWNGAPA